MWQILTFPLKIIQQIGKVAVLPFQKASTAFGLRKVILWTCHIVLILGFLVFLGWLGWSTGLSAYVRIDNYILRLLWLPLVGLLVYAIFWTVWWMWRTFRESEEFSLFPDIDRALDEAVQRLRGAGIEANSLPWFLVLGTPTSSRTAFFKSAGTSFHVAPVPYHEDAPCFICATTEAVYLCCDKVSLLGSFSAYLKQYQSDDWGNDEVQNLASDWFAFNRSDAPSGENAYRQSSEETYRETPDQVDAASSFDAASSYELEADKKAESEAGLDKTISMLLGDTKPEDNEEVPEQAEEPQGAEAPPSGSPEHYQSRGEMNDDEAQECPAHHAAFVETTQSRLRHLCSRIVTYREPYCPINGVLLVVPAMATTDDTIANEVTQVIRNDLRIAYEVFQISSPVITIVSDLEEVVGATMLLEKFPERQKGRRLGVHFPRFDEFDNHQIEKILTAEIDWLCDELIPPIIYRLCDSPATELEEDLRRIVKNRNLFLFQMTWQGRSERLSRMLKNIFLADAQRTFTPRGLYFVATGEDMYRSQGFARDILDIVDPLQDEARWSGTKIKVDRQYRFLASSGYLALACVAAMLVIGMLVFRK